MDSQIGAQDTFHYTNAAPQVQTYNDIDWGNLEDYLLDKAQSTDKRLIIFTGPIFRENSFTAKPERVVLGKSRCRSGRSPCFRSPRPKSQPQRSLSDRPSMCRRCMRRRCFQD
ncbi:DNA/RNA non-specific endonuclease [Rhizobium sp. NZLR11]|uniref:DNA/RNA non-specific endonuclease n=1 Tax=Rhizobium sp. NZLR11 TaxID=2731098 RepID=UPI00287FB7A9|nr:DNA/RNA non-specific endonuclease [Rhizobium sp. NZLR11]